MQNEKRSDIVIIRVCSMIMIVLCHTIKFYTFIPGSQVYGVIFNVGVEVFFCVSGFLYGNKCIDNFFRWIKKRIQRVWIPVFIVVLIDLVALNLIYSVRTGLLTVTAYLLNLQGLLFIDWNLFSKFFSEITNLGPLWFTTVIMCCYLLIPAFQNIRERIGKRKNRTLWYVIILGIIYLGCFLIQFETNIILFYFANFYTGYVLANIYANKKSYKKFLVPLLVLVIFVLLGIRIVLRTFLDGQQLYICLVSIGHSIIGMNLMIIGLELKKGYGKIFDYLASTRIISFLDAASFYIYLVHGIFCMGVTNIYSNMSIGKATVLFIICTLIFAKLVWVITNIINNFLDKIIYT